MKVLILANYMMGLMSFRRELLQALRTKGYDVVVSAPYDKKYDGQMEELGCRIVETKVDRRGINLLTDLGLIIRYSKLLKAERPDVVLSYTIKPNLYGGLVCKWAKVPQLVNITGLGTAVENPGLLQKFVIGLYKVCMNKVRVMFFQNTANMEFCKEHGMISGRPELLPGSGVNFERFEAKPMPEGDMVKFIFVSRVMKQKGIEEYLGMAERIKKEYPNTEFHVLGACDDGDYKERLEKMQAEGTIIYDGVTNDVRPYLHNVHCTVHPTFYPEGMSNVLLESCASGRAIITTNRPGCREIVEASKTGYVCREQDVDDLTAKVREYLALSAEQRAAMGRAAREKVAKEFDRQIVINKYLEEIEKIKNSK